MEEMQIHDQDWGSLTPSPLFPDVASLARLSAAFALGRKPPGSAGSASCVATPCFFSPRPDPNSLTTKKATPPPHPPKQEPRGWAEVNRR